MDNEDELPKELEKLSISPLWMQNNICQINLPNENSKIEVEEGEEDLYARRIFDNASQKDRSLGCRRCRLRRSSESTLDELKVCKVNSSNSIQCLSQGHNVIRGTLKQVLKGSQGMVRRRIILREPILKALHTCLSPHNSFRKRFMFSENNNKSLGVGVSTCHDLIVKCHGLLKDDVEFRCRLAHLNLNTRDEKKCIRLKTLTEKKKEISRKPSNMLLHIQTLNVNEDNNIDESISTNNTQQSAINSLHSLNMDNTDNMRLGTSCSQQASTSSSGNTCDDVTIDELASYFDTFVYIPKKMSSMAEMMYI